MPAATCNGDHGVSETVAGGIPGIHVWDYCMHGHNWQYACSLHMGGVNAYHTHQDLTIYRVACAGCASVCADE